MNPASENVGFLIVQLTGNYKYSNIFSLMVRAQIMNYPEGDNFVRKGNQIFTVEEWAARGIASGLVMLNHRGTSPVITHHDGHDGHDEFVIDDDKVIGYANAKIVLLKLIRRRTNTPPRLREVNEIIDALNAEIEHFNHNHINHRPPQQGGRKNKTMKKNNKKAKKTRNNRK